MEEVILEKIEKNEADEKWNKHNEAEAKENGEVQPSKRQKAYIEALARSVGLKVDVSKMGNREEASRLIENLKLMNRRTNGNGFDSALRDKRVAFGMATKLVFKKYMDRHKEVRKSKKFWQEVEELYREYQSHQESVVHSPFTDALELYQRR